MRARARGAPAWCSTRTPRAQRHMSTSLNERGDEKSARAVGAKVDADAAQCFRLTCCPHDWKHVCRESEETLRVCWAWVGPAQQGLHEHKQRTKDATRTTRPRRTTHSARRTGIYTTGRVACTRVYAAAMRLAGPEPGIIRSLPSRQSQHEKNDITTVPGAPRAPVRTVAHSAGAGSGGAHQLRCSHGSGHYCRAYTAPPAL